MKDENRGWYLIFAVIVGFFAYIIAAYIDNLPVLIGLSVGFSSGLTAWVLNTTALSENAQNAHFVQLQKEVQSLRQQIYDLQRRIGD